MSFTVLYHWRLHPGRSEAFAAAWSRGTHLIHRWCGSFGARLHFSGDHAWSYARWPSADARTRCFERPEVQDDPSFPEMQACISEHFDEIVLDIVDDQLREPRNVVHPLLTLTTERLRLRPMRIEDAWSLHAAFSDATQMRYWSGDVHSSMEETLAAIESDVGNRDVQAFSITRLQDPDDALGKVVLMDRRPDVVEIGFFLRPDSQRQGYALEAVKAVVAHAFNTRGVRRIYADTDPDNTASIRLLQSAGFQEEGRLRAQWHTHIGIRDSLIFGRLATDRPGQT
ncbi:MAG: GNAT family protein [Myxococcota bacterium]